MRVCQHQLSFLLDFVGAMYDGVVVTTGAIRRAKLQSNHQQNSAQFYGPDSLPAVSWDRAWLIRPSRTCITLPNMVVLSQTVRAYKITESRRKNLTPRILPFKATKGHWKRHGSIGYPRLPLSYRFRWKITFFPTLRAFNAPPPAKGSFYWNFVTEVDRAPINYIKM